MGRERERERGGRKGVCVPVGVMRSGGKVTTVKDSNGVSTDPGGREAWVCGLSIAGIAGSNPALRV